jgi:hypothetical protein
MRCVAATFAVALAGADATVATASQVGMEGTDVVVRFDPDEQIQVYDSLYGPSPAFVVRTDTATGTVTATTDAELPPGTIVTPNSQIGNPAWASLAPRAGAGCARTTGRTVACPLPGARRIRIEFGTAAGPTSRTRGEVQVRATSLAVAVQGGPNGNTAAINTTGAVAMDGGGGDDSFTVLGAPAGGTVDLGPGNDELVARTDRVTPVGLRVSGGPGNDFIATFDHRIETFAPAPVSRQTIDCGAGADRLSIDDRDVAGPGCAPAVTGLKTGATLGRFDSAGRIALPAVRVRSTSNLRFEVGGPRPPSFTIPTGPSGTTPTTVFGTRSVPRARGTVRTNVRARPSVRSALRTRRTPVTSATVSVRARRGGDETTVLVRGTLRPGATAR